jgi:hypothetical protein
MYSSGGCFEDVYDIQPQFSFPAKLKTLTVSFEQFILAELADLSKVL